MNEPELTAEQKQALDDMVARRVVATGETAAEAAEHIAKYLRGASWATPDYHRQRTAEWRELAAANLEAERHRQERKRIRQEVLDAVRFHQAQATAP